MSQALVTCPSAGRPVQLTKWVSCIPSSRARLFIRSTNSSVTPAVFSARATAASLPLDTHTPFSRSSTVMLSPSDRKIRLPPMEAA